MWKGGETLEIVGSQREAGKTTHNGLLKEIIVN